MRFSDYVKMLELADALLYRYKTTTKNIREFVKGKTGGHVMQVIFKNELLSSLTVEKEGYLFVYKRIDEKSILYELSEVRKLNGNATSKTNNTFQ